MLGASRSLKLEGNSADNTRAGQTRQLIVSMGKHEQHAVSLTYTVMFPARVPASD